MIRLADKHENAGCISKTGKFFRKKFFTNKKKACKIKPLFFYLISTDDRREIPIFYELNRAMPFSGSAESGERILV